MDNIKITITTILGQNLENPLLKYYFNNNDYDNFIKTFVTVLNKHAPPKKKIFHPTQDWGMEVWEQKAPPTSFSPITSTNVGISPQNFLTFSFNPSATFA